MVILKEDDKINDYHVDGQLARADYGNGGRAGCPQPAGSEDFLWDGLALIKRGDERFLNEPHVGGGNPVVSSKGTTYFNDILGTTVGIWEGRASSRPKSGRKYTPAALTAFGEDLTLRCQPQPSTSTSFYTGKPEVAGLGHAFLFRNYRASLAKWQTADPFGYPDGWNQLAYCGNGVAHRVDIFGTVWGNLDFLSYYFRQDPSRTDPIDTDVMGLTGAILGNIEAQVYPSFAEYIDARARSYITSAEPGRLSFPVGISYGVACEDICFSLGGGSVRFTVKVTGYWDTYLENGCEYVYYMWQADGTCKYSDEFRDAVDVFNLIKKDTYIDLGVFFIGVVGGAGVGITIPENWEFPYGRPYGYSHVWDYSQWRDGVIKRPE